MVTLGLVKVLIVGVCARNQQVAEGRSALRRGRGSCVGISVVNDAIRAGD